MQEGVRNYNNQQNNSGLKHFIIGTRCRKQFHVGGRGQCRKYIYIISEKK